MKKTYLLITIGLLIVSCEKSQEEILTDYSNIMTLKVENDNAYADNFDKIKLVAEFPENFNTEDDGKVDFYIYKDTEEHLTEPIRLVQENGVLKKICDVYVKHNKNESLNIKAVIKIGGIETSKTTTIVFKKAFFDNLNIFSSALTVNSNSFSTIQLTSELTRDNGIVTLNSLAETEVKDNLGNTIGIFTNYKNKTDATGKIINNFTLGNNNYSGILYAITSSINEQGTIKKDTITLYAN